MTLNEWTILIFSVALLFGSFVRFFPGFQAGFPLNDGGMFLSMIRDLKTSHYLLPEFTSYNQLQIPYAYPPLGFYLARILSDLLQIPELDLVHWLPPLMNSLSILAFFLLASELLKSKSLAALASAFYALTPGAFGWFVMGGGLTRSLGSLFLVLTLFSVLRLFRTAEWKYVGLAIVLGGLTVLSHPEAGVHAAASCVLLWMFFGRTVKTFIKACVVGVGVLLISVPWWIAVLSYHGLAPFISALHSGSYGVPLWRALMGAIFTQESFVPIMTLLRLIGLIWGVWKKEYFLVVWAIVPFLVEPRSAPSIVFYPLSMLSALAFADAIPFLFSRITKRNTTLTDLYKSNIYNAILFLVLIYLFVESGLYGFRLVNNSLKPADLAAMNWVEENTPANSSFIVLTGVKSPEIDPFTEWFPALSQRHSVSTVQGIEWLGSGKFGNYYSQLTELQSCTSAVCVETWSEQINQEYQYVVIAKRDMGDILIHSFRDDENYVSIYSTDDVDVYKLDK